MRPSRGESPAPSGEKNNKRTAAHTRRNQMRSSFRFFSSAYFQLLSVLAVYTLLATSAANAKNQYPPYELEAYTVVVSPNNLMAEDDDAALQNGNYVYELNGKRF